MKASILTMAMGVALAWPTTGYADGDIFERLFFGSDFSHRAHEKTAGRQSSNPLIPHRIDGLSDDVNDCARYGCVGVGGG